MCPGVPRHDLGMDVSLEIPALLVGNQTAAEVDSDDVERTDHQASVLLPTGQAASSAVNACGRVGVLPDKTGGSQPLGCHPWLITISPANSPSAARRGKVGTRTTEGRPNAAPDLSPLRCS